MFIRMRMKAKRTHAKERQLERVAGGGQKNFLTESEMKRFLDAARGGRHSVRDYVMMLVTYRHGLRVSELIDILIKDLDLDTGRLFVRRVKGSLSTHQPIEGDELRALRAWLRVRDERGDARSPYLFLSERGPLTRHALNYLVRQTGKRAKLSFHVHPHMLRHSTGYYLANKGFDTRLIQDGCVAKNVLRRKGASSDFRYAATPNNSATNFACPATSMPSNLFTCALCNMCIASTPSNVRSAVWKERKHCIARHLLRTKR